MIDDGATRMPAAPPASGVRLLWADLPDHLREAVEGWLGSLVVTARSQASGFSPGVAARLTTADGRRVFAKVVGSEPNVESPELHRREARIVAALPPNAPVPRLLWSYEGDDGWVALLFEDVEGREPVIPWRADELDRVIDAIVELSAALTPSPIAASVTGTVETWELFTRGWWRQIRDHRPSGVDAWSVRHLSSLVAREVDAAAAASGDTLLHLDLRADNMLVTDERVLIVDWPHARIGAPWLDLAFFAPSVAMQGGPAPEQLFARHPLAAAADPDAVTAVIAAIAGFFTCQSLQPAPPGLPTVRAFQAAQGVVARQWLATRTGWT